MIVLATDLLIVARRIDAAPHGRTIKAPKVIPLLYNVDDAAQSQDAGAERLELGSLGRLRQYISSELTEITNGYTLPC